MNDGIALNADAFESSVHYLVINKYYVLGYTVMLLYDHLLTLDGEIECIWRQRFTLPTYLFFIFRYATPFVCILNLIAEHDPAWTQTRCDRWIWLPIAIGAVISATTGVILILRTHTLYGRALWVLYAIVPVYIAQLAVMGWSISAGSPAQLPTTTVGCIPSQKPGTNNRLLGSYITTLIFDVSIFLLTFLRAIHIRIQSARIPLVDLIVRDGITYFFALCIVNLVNVCLLVLAPPALSAMNARFSNLITAALVSRLMLNLRAAGARVQVGSSSSSSVRPLSTVADVGEWRVAPRAGGSTFGVGDFNFGYGGAKRTDVGAVTRHSIAGVTQANVREWGSYGEFGAMEMQDMGVERARSAGHGDAVLAGGRALHGT